MEFMRLGKSDMLQAHMKQRVRFVAATLLIALARADNASLAGNAVRIRVDPQTTYQIIDGFGASDAWQCQFVGKNCPVRESALDHSSRVEQANADRSFRPVPCRRAGHTLYVAEFSAKRHDTDAIKKLKVE